MRYLGIVAILFAIFSIQSALADDDMMSSSSKPCGAIAKACLDAGYTRNSSDKKFWQDCMKPVILGQTVKNVTIDADTVKSCRNDKINELKKETEEFEKASK